MSDVRIIVRGLSKRYRRGPDHPQHAGIGTALLRPYRRLRGLPVAAPRPNASEFWALQDVTFDVHDGERIGIIGRNGAGKSTLLKILSRIIYPTEGEARIRGRVTSLLEVGTGFNPGLSGRENIYLNASVHGLERKEIDVRFEDIVEFSGIREFIDTPVKHYSSGMYMRLAFSVAAHLDPDILLLDEVLAVGDISFQQKCLKRVEGLTAEGRTVLFVSHSMDAITRFCSRCIWLEHGKIAQDGPTREVCEAYVEEALDIKSSQQWSTAPFESGVDRRGQMAQAAETASPDQASLAKGHPTGNGDGIGLECDQNGAKERTLAAQLDAQAERTADGPRTQVPTSPSARAEAFPTDHGTAVPETVGTDEVRILSARIITQGHAPASAVPIDEPVGIEIAYQVLRAEKPLVPAIALTAPDETLVFWAVCGGQRLEIKPVGTYVSIAWLPPHFLNTGKYAVTLSIVTPDPMERHFVLDRVLSFYSTEAQNVETAARGPMARNFPGVIRPRLTWETLLLDKGLDK